MKIHENLQNLINLLVQQGHTKSTEESAAPLDPLLMPEASATLAAGLSPRYCVRESNLTGGAPLITWARRVEARYGIGMSRVWDELRNI